MENEESAVQSPAAPTNQQMKVTAAIAELNRRIHSGGNWFYWIAGLSLINALVLAFNGHFMFVVGLAATQIVGELASEHRGVVTIIGLLVNLSITGVYGLFGYCATSRMRWAFIVGMVFYSLDALVFLLIKDWLAFGFHMFALIGISSGLRADGVLRGIEAEIRRTPPAQPNG